MVLVRGHNIVFNSEDVFPHRSLLPHLSLKLSQINLCLEVSVSLLLLENKILCTLKLFLVCAVVTRSKRRAKLTTKGSPSLKTSVKFRCQN